MNKIKPSFEEPLWIIRTVLLLLFPPLLFPEFIIGSLICYRFCEPGFLTWFVGYAILLCSVFCGAMGTYSGTTFEISPNGVSYNLNFLWSKRKEVLLTNIKEVELKIGFLQRVFGVGTIVMHTQASTAGKNKTGLSLFDIENPDKVYELLKENISKAAKISEK